MYILKMKERKTQKKKKIKYNNLDNAKLFD